MSFSARGEWACRRHRDAAGLRPSQGVTRHGDWIRRCEAGFGLVEMVIALAVLVIITLPIVHIILETETASDAVHLRAEAADLATQALETVQYQTQNGINPTAGITTSAQISGNNPFTVAVDSELVAGTGADSSICIDPPGQLSSQIWTVKATVTWGTGYQKATLTESTLVSPSEADLADTNAAEIAVPVYNADELTYETATAINITVTGTCLTGAGTCGTVPSNEETIESENTGSTGCAVFPDLFAGAGEEYKITVSPPLGWVDPNELFYNEPASTQFGLPVPVHPNQVTVADNPQLVLALGATMGVNFQTVSFTTPVNVHNVSTTSGSTSVTVASGSFAGVTASSPGMLVSGPGILPGTTVASYTSGSQTLTLSAAADATATGSGTVTLTFTATSSVAAAPDLPITVYSNLLCNVPETDACVLGNLTGSGTSYFSSTTSQTALLFPGPAVTSTTTANYSAWSGDQVDSEPGQYSPAGYQTSFQALSGTPVTLTATAGIVTLPVYPLTLKVTSGTATGFTATDVDTMALNGHSGTFATGLPLGQFEIEATGTGGVNETVSPAWVWITPTGVCSYSSESDIGSNPCSTPLTSAISVTVS